MKKPQRLRKQAESLLAGQPQDADRTLTMEETLHELRVHQVELEMQNEELRKAQQTIEASRTSYANLYDFSPVGYLTLDKSGLILKANLTISGMLGVERSLLIKKPFSSYISPAFQGAFREHRRQVLQGQKKHSCELMLEKNSAKPFFVSLESLPVETGDGRNILSVVSDIEVRKRAEDALRIISAYNRNLIEASPDPLVAIDHNGKISDVNVATERVTGYSRDIIVGSDFSDYFADPEKARASYQLAFREGVVNDYELEIRHADGHFTPVLYNASVYKDETGKVIGVFAVARDISERRRIEKALVESEERYRTAIENASDGIALVKGEKHVYVNRRFTEMFGHDDPSEIIGKPLALTVHPDDVERVLEINRMRQMGETVPFRYEFKGIKKDGTQRLIEVSAARTHYRGEPVSLAYLRDITDYKSLEEQLRQSQKMEAIGTLAGGIAHDFNNILAGIIGFTELAMEDIPPDNPVYHYMERVLKGGYRGRDLVRQILAFSRHSDHEKKPIALSHVVEEAVKLLRPAFPSSIEIQMRLHGNRDTILADPVQMHQVVLNLCTNAAHAMRDTGGVLEITIGDEDFSELEAIRSPDLSPGAYVRLSVSDQGCGITPDVINKIFDPFFTTKAPGEGTGMGLSVVHGIARNHGGHVTVNSELGKGSTFHVYLPRTEAVAAADAESPRQISGGNECILFVDDEEQLVELNLQRLRDLGYMVVATTSSVEALKAFAAEPDRFDLVIVDYTMPHMTGIDLATKLLEIRPDIRIILSSGFNEQIGPEMIKQTGIKAFIAKTAGKRELAKLIRQVLEQ
jgi:PAS domain S-box-containing protein